MKKLILGSVLLFLVIGFNSCGRRDKCPSVYKNTTNTSTKIA